MDLVPKEFKNQPSVINAGESMKSFDQNASFWRAAVAIGLLLPLLFLAAWGALIFYNKSLTNQIEQTKKAYEGVFDKNDQALFAGLQDMSQAAEILKTGLKNHIYSSQIFDEVASSTVPQVQWTYFSVSIPEKTLKLKGLATNYTALAKQMILFKEGGFSEIDISNIGLEKAGGVGFEASLKFNSKILNKLP